MIDIVICDDDSTELHHIKRLTETYFNTHPDTDYSISVFEAPESLYSAVERGKTFNIYLLDILMPGQDGIALGEKLRSLNPDAILIYLSSSPDYALKAFHVYAFQYLLKPIVKEDFFSVMDRVLDLMAHQENGYFTIKTKQGLHSLCCREICYIEYRNHLIYIHMEDSSIYESITLRQSFPDTVADLSQYSFFVKPHKSFLVNLYHVHLLQKTDFKMKDKTLIPISRNNYSEIKREYIDFLIRNSKDKTNGSL